MLFSTRTRSNNEGTTISSFLHDLVSSDNLARQREIEIERPPTPRKRKMISLRTSKEATSLTGCSKRFVGGL